ncbi:hypothetical protein ACFPTX_12850 [Pseudomonas sp. GCM10022188]|uniref:M23 family metallopeptidase n=1 Tax=Pseudomonas TaxID=286 RepID=UPI001E5A6B33|nr:M23 family metallopeptidase [Pseudomonas oryzagri]MCC6075356.1 M23 family metallopeptidase [Pseudomonas oryzagri]
MIISPPFIPTPISGENDQSFLDRAMQGGTPGDGGFPLSYDLNWHGGIHLTAPREGSATLPVRAIADGTVAYFRHPLAFSDDSLHPLNYRGNWTDNGCIILRHETEIGEGEKARVVFYSIYQHFSSIILTNPSIGMQIYRKDILGNAGKIYGVPDKIHFEIISNEPEKLLGRSTATLNYLTGNGRTDSCWGDIHFYLPPEVLCHADHPSTWLDANNTSTALSRPNENLFIRIRYAQGQCTLSTFTENGELLGERQEAPDYEYDLYKTACQHYPACPSSGYELLRFGRVLGPDALQPANAAHWRKIALPGGTSAWVNLHSPTVTCFSDADFPHWQGWQLIDDDNDADSHCQSPRLRTLLKLHEDPLFSDQTDAVSIANSSAYNELSAEEKDLLSERYALEHQRNTALLNNSVTQSNIKRCIFKFASEWSKNEFDARYGWLLKVADGGPLHTESYEKLKSHQQALAFWEEANLDGIEINHWHFPPREFIEAFRKCGWLSQSEFKQLIPKHALRKISATQHAWEPVNTNLTSPTSTLTKNRTPLNKMMRTYGINTPMRIASFMGNSIQETSWLSRTSEGSGSTSWYAPWYGRGFLQLTNPGNYIDYWRYRGRSISNTLYDALTTAYNQIYAQPPSLRNNSQLQDINFSGLTIEIQRWRSHVEGNGTTNEDLYSPSDSAGFYWISKKMAKYSDQPHTLERVSATTNQGGKFYYRSISFWKATAIVNLPSALNTYYSTSLNGFDSRCCAYNYAIAVLSEERFPDAHGTPSLEFPELYQPRRE